MTHRLSAIQEQFRRQADAYEKLREVHDERGLEAIVALSQADGESRVLDVACGPGFLTMAFARRCRDATGVDATDVFLAHARAEAARRGLGHVRFLLGDAERLPFPSATFDVAVCRAAFHHFPRPCRVLAEMMRVSRRRLVVADMLADEDPAKAELHNRIERLCDPTHARALSESELVALFAEHGLRLAFSGKSRLDYSLSEWLSHGGPPPERVREIEALLAGSLDRDTTGLDVHLEDGEIHLRHVGAAFLLEKP